MIKPEGIPAFVGSLSMVSRAAGDITAVGNQVVTVAQGLERTFRAGMESTYRVAPERDRLLAAMLPVKQEGEQFGPELGKVADALHAFVDEVQGHVRDLGRVKARAYEFIHKIGDTPQDEIDDNEEWVQEENRLHTDLHNALDGIQAAELRCANKIAALYGGRRWDESSGLRDGDQPPPQVDEEQEPPWGEPLEYDKPWYEDGLSFATSYFKGVLVDGFLGTLTSLQTLGPGQAILKSLGVDSVLGHELQGWGEWAQAWKGLGLTAAAAMVWSVPGGGPLMNQLFPQTAQILNNTLITAGKGIVAWDMWSEDPGRALGQVGFNVVATVGTGGAGAGLRTAALAGRYGAAAAVTARAVNVVSKLRPGQLALETAMRLPKVAEVAARLADSPVLGGLGRVALDMPPSRPLPGSRHDLSASVGGYDVTGGRAPSVPSGPPRSMDDGLFGPADGPFGPRGSDPISGAAVQRRPDATPERSGDLPSAVVSRREPIGSSHGADRPDAAADFVQTGWHGGTAHQPSGQPPAARHGAHEAPRQPDGGRGPLRPPRAPTRDVAEGHRHEPTNAPGNVPTNIRGPEPADLPQPTPRSDPGQPQAPPTLPVQDTPTHTRPVDSRRSGGDGARRFVNETGDPAYDVSVTDRRAFRERYPVDRSAHEALRQWRARLPLGVDIPDEGLLAINRLLARSDFHMDVNAALSSGEPVRMAAFDVEVRNAVSALNKLPDFRGRTERGIDVPAGDLAEFLDRYQPGRSVIEPRFTTSDPRVGHAGNVQLHIDSRHGKQVSSDRNISDSTVVHPPGNQFRVERRWYDDDTDTWHVDLTDQGRIEGRADVRIPREVPHRIARHLQGLRDAGGEVVVVRHGDSRFLELKQQADALVHEPTTDPSVRHGRYRIHSAFSGDYSDSTRQHYVAVTLQGDRLLAATHFDADDGAVFVHSIGAAYDTRAGAHVPGAGTCALFEAIRHADRRGIPVGLAAHADAQPFYRGLGMSVEAIGGDSSLPLAGVRVMVREVEQLRGPLDDAAVRGAGNDMARSGADRATPERDRSGRAGGQVGGPGETTRHFAPQWPRSPAPDDDGSPSWRGFAEEE